MSSHRGRAMVHQVLLGSWGSYRWFWVDHGALICVDPLGSCCLRQIPLSLCRYCDSFFQVEAKGRWAFASFCFTMTPDFIDHTSEVSLNDCQCLILIFHLKYFAIVLSISISLGNRQVNPDPIKAEQNVRNGKQQIWFFVFLEVWPDPKSNIYIYIHSLYYKSKSYIYTYVIWNHLDIYDDILYDVYSVIWHPCIQYMVYECIWRVYDMIHTLGVGCFNKSRRHKFRRQEKYGPKMARWGKLLCSWDWMILRMEAPKKRHWLDTLHLLDFNNMYIHTHTAV